MPATDDIMTTEPPPERRINGMPYFTVRNTPSTLIAICRRQSASDMSSAEPMIPMPAFATSMCNPPSFSAAAMTSGQPVSSVTS
jgi:hypothetical protein